MTEQLASTHVPLNKDGMGCNHTKSQLASTTANATLLGKQHTKHERPRFGCMSREQHHGVIAEWKTAECETDVTGSWYTRAVDVKGAC